MIAVLQNEPETGLGAFARVLERMGVSYEVVDTSTRQFPARESLDGVIALGGSLSAHDPRLIPTVRWIRASVLAGLPFLGVCLGGQLLASALGAEIARLPRPEVGIHDIYLTDAASRDRLFAGLPGRLAVFACHEDSFGLPRGAVPLAGSLGCTYQGFRFGARAYALQFHAEVRPRDLHGWDQVQAYRKLFDHAGGRAAVTRELERATSALETLADQLVERWLDLTSEPAAADPRLRAAV